MKYFTYIKNGKSTGVGCGDVIPETAIECPAYVMHGDTIADGKYYRNGVELTDPGYNIPIGELFVELTDAELNTIIATAFPAATAQQRGIIGFLFRAAAQTEIHSSNKRIPAARALFSALLGEERMNELFRQR